VQVTASVGRAAVVSLGATPSADTLPLIDVVLGDGRVVRVRHGFVPEDSHHVLVVLEALGERAGETGPREPRGGGDPPC
jgi:hypothetical protein